jgi:ABC-2 type transport system permease protein
VIDAIRSEWIKLRTVRSSVVLLIAIVVVSVGFAVLISSLSDLQSLRDDATQRLVPGLFGGAVFDRLLFGVIGVLMIGQEYRFNTIRVTFTGEPRRLRVVAAKAVVLLTGALVVAAVAIGAAVAISMPILRSRGVPVDLGAPGAGANIVGAVVECVIAALVGLGVGAIVRQPIGGIIFMTVWPLIVENIVASLLPKIGQWLPFFEGFRLVQFDRERPEHVFSRVGGGLYFAAFGVLVVVIGGLLVQRRDA